MCHHLCMPMNNEVGDDIVATLIQAEPELEQKANECEGSKVTML